jgi:hypothetical protein
MSSVQFISIQFNSVEFNFIRPIQEEIVSSVIGQQYYLDNNYRFTKEILYIKCTSCTLLYGYNNCTSVVCVCVCVCLCVCVCVCVCVCTDQFVTLSAKGNIDIVKPNDL